MILILICFLLVIINLHQTSELSLRESVIRSYLLLMGFIAALIESLSLFNMITRSWVVVGWILLAVILLGFIFKTLQTRNFTFSDLSVKDHLSRIKNRSSFEMITWISIGLILVITLGIALLSPPNNYDFMTYHMSRVSNWIQNQSIKYYTTSIPRQNYSMPFAEYAILNLQLISRSDRFANLVQWISFPMILLMIMEIAAYLKISRRGQLVSVLFAATMPMALLQSTSTQNDLLTAFFCLSFTFFLLRAIRQNDWKVVLFAGLSLGLALYTKGTAYLYCGLIELVIGLVALLETSQIERMGLIKDWDRSLLLHWQ